MTDLIDLLIRSADDPDADADLGDAIRAHVQAVQASVGGAGRRLVTEVEDAVRADPAAAFAFDETGQATLTAAGRTYQAGRFETPSIGGLRSRAVQARAGSAGGRVRLWVLNGRSPATDIGSLQATAAPGTLFQVASQFNCLESPGPYLTRVARYFDDPTQGPRASISAFPATLLRHYRAPGPDGGRFTQESRRQINLLADALPPEVAQVDSGYLTDLGVPDPQALINALVDNFDQIRVGVHDGAQVVLGYNWDGAVEDSEKRRIAQILTSTFAGGGYSSGQLGPAFRPVCRQLLNAAYLGTLLAALTLGKRRAVLTLIGGGVFGNPVEDIWDAILWAIEEVRPIAPGDLDVVVNGYNLGPPIDQARILASVRPHGGALLAFDTADLAGVWR